MHKVFWMSAALLIAAAAAAAAPIPWDLVEGGSELKGIYKEVAEEVVAQAKSYGGCDQTIAACLAANPNDKIALRLAAFVARRVRADKDTDEILQEIENRLASAFPEKTFQPDLSNHPFSGDAKAPIQVVVYADFGCPYCRATATALRKLTVESPKSVVYYFKNYPLKSNDQAVPAALAALAAQKQGKFWEMHDLLFGNHGDLTAERIDECAAGAGLDMARFQADLKDPHLVSRLRAEKMEGLGYGVQKTPGILVNGKLYQGVRTWEELKDRIDEERDLLAMGK